MSAFSYEILTVVTASTTVFIKTGEEYNYNKYNIIFGKVLYNKKDFIYCLSIIDNSIQDILLVETENELEQKYAINKAFELSNYILSILFCIKTEPHSIEEEYRIVIIPYQDFKILDFRNKNGLITPYIDMIFPKLPLEEIVIGPKINDIAAKSGIDELLLAYDFNNINVRISNLQLR
jgi:hypothetical protein